MKLKKVIKYSTLVVLLIISCLIIYYNLIFVVKLKTSTFSHDETVNIEFDAYYKGKKVTDEVTVEKGTFDGTVGKYEVTFIYWHNGKKYKQTRKISIVDNVAPKINLIGGNKVIITKESQYNELGYSAIDNYDGDIKDKVIINGEVNTNQIGTYKIVYSVKDSSGNEGKNIREVEVAAESPLDMNIKKFTLKELFTDSILPEAQDDSTNDKYIDNLVIIGDNSTLNYLSKNITKKNILYKWSLNLGDDLYNKLGMVNYISKNPKKTYLISMSNQKILDYDKDGVLVFYKEFVNSAQSINKSIKIIIQSYLPVSDESTEIDNDKINKVNFYLAEFSSSMHIKFLNTAEIMKDENGYCSKDYCSKEIVTSQGKEKLIKYLLSHKYIDED